MRHMTVRVAWVCWGIDLLAVLYACGLVVSDPHRDSMQSVAYFLLVVLLALLAGAGGLLYWLARRRSSVGLIIMAVILAWPALGLIADPTITGMKRWSRQREEARIGSFRDPVLQQLGEAIRQNDLETMRRLLATTPDLQGKDRAGNDMLTYAVSTLRDRQGGVEPVKLLLATGLNPNHSRTPSGLDLVNFLIVSSQPEVQEVVRLLLEHGADANAVDPVTGETPLLQARCDINTVRALMAHGADINRPGRYGLPAVVNFVIPERCWDAALYLVAQGADLDRHDEHGVSLDYYLEEWSKGTYGALPDGYQQLREAVATRRGLAH